MAGAAAFFDLDKTLIDTDAGFAFGTHLLELARIEIDQAVGRKRREMKRQYRRFVAEVYAKFVVFVPLYKLRLMKRSRLVRESYVFYRDQSIDRFTRALDAFFENELAKRVYPEVERVLEWHRQQGHTTVLITSGMVPIAERYADMLGIELVEGVRLEQKDGMLTGEVTGPLYGADKADVALRLAEEHGWSLADSYAYTDHDSDRHLLELVGHPRPVHPNKRLAKLAKRKGWEVVDFADPDRALLLQPGASDKADEA